MKRIGWHIIAAGLLSGIFGCGKQATPPSSEWQTFTHPTAGFEVRVPPEWSENTESDFLQFVAPNDQASVTISAYVADGGPFADFVEHRFQDIQAFYKQTDEKRMPGPPVMYIRHYQGIWPNEDAITHYVVACINVGDAYVSVGIVAEPDFYKKHEKDLLKLVQSIKKKSEQSSRHVPK